jgi:hypothetical protein
MAGITARFKTPLITPLFVPRGSFTTSAVSPDLGAAAQRLLTISEEAGRTDVSPEGSLVQYSWNNALEKIMFRLQLLVLVKNKTR